MKLKRIIVISIIILTILIVLFYAINLFVVLSVKSNIKSKEELKDKNEIDAILILGAGIWGNKPSHMLEDRLLEGIDCYDKNISNKIIMSGDHGKVDYDEVNLMKKFAIDKGVPTENIFMDHAGFSTYESIYRAKEIFGAKKIVIITQEYHLYRALYIAKALGLDAYGVKADRRGYAGQSYRILREILARDKDFIKCIFKPEPTYLGDRISLSENGDITNDKD